VALPRRVSARQPSNFLARQKVTKERLNTSFSLFVSLVM
jgi:hypothetical protein